jgi:hypothetical protein
LADIFGQLGDLLVAANAHLSIAPKVSTRSTIYDLDYRLSIVACAMHTLSTADVLGERKVLANWLKLAQFTAMRPALLSHFLEWLDERKAPTLASQRWRRGFVGDRMHDAVIELLAAEGVLHRQGDLLFSGSRYSMLAEIEATVRSRDVFRNERFVLAKFADLRPIKAMLGGA